MFYDIGYRKKAAGFVYTGNSKESALIRRSDHFKVHSGNISVQPP